MTHTQSSRERSDFKWTEQLSHKKYQASQQPLHFGGVWGPHRGQMRGCWWPWIPEPQSHCSCFFLSLSCHTACRILVIWTGIQLRPQQWKQQVLTIGPPGNSQPLLGFMDFHTVLSEGHKGRKHLFPSPREEAWKAQTPDKGQSGEAFSPKGSFWSGAELCFLLLPFVCGKTLAKE